MTEEKRSFIVDVDYEEEEPRVFFYTEGGEDINPVFSVSLSVKQAMAWFQVLIERRDTEEFRKDLTEDFWQKWKKVRR